MLDKTEHPERFNPSIDRTEVLDHDPTVVLRRTWPSQGRPFAEYVSHTLRRHRVEYQRYGHTWSTAQALVDTKGGRYLVYEVRGAERARCEGGIDIQHARRTLRCLLEHAQRTNGHAVNGHAGRASKPVQAEPRQR